MRKWVEKKGFLLDRKIITLTVFGFICAIILVCLVHISISTLSGVRAYVAGEGYWSKSQKESLIYLSNYIHTGDEELYEHFNRVNDVIIGDMDARIQMVSQNYDVDKISRGLTRGLNHPDDIEDMIYVYQWFNWVPQVEKAFQIWQEGDEKTLELLDFATSIHSAYQNGTVSSSQKEEWVKTLVEIEHDFNTLESSFSEPMGEMARLVDRILRWSSITLGFLLFSVGGFLLYRHAKSTEEWASTMRQSEEKFRAMLNNSRDVLYKMNLADERYEYVSGGLKDMIGYETSEFLNGGPKWIYSKIHPEDKENMARVIERYKKVNKDHFLPIVEFRLQDVNGNYKWVSNSRTLMKDADGNPEAIVGTVRDISDIKEQEEQLRKSLKEKEILLQEIHHRVKNNLAIVSSLLELQKDGMSEEVQEMLSDSQSRIQSIAKVHEKLYESTTLSEIPMDSYISELAVEIAKAYESKQKNIKMEIVVEPFVMELNQAIPCGLVLNELINNCYKHGFKNLREGTIRILLNKKADCMELVVENNGNKLDEDFDPAESSSLGMTLIDVLIQRFNGKLKIEKGDWTRFKICISK